LAVLKGGHGVSVWKHYKEVKLKRMSIQEENLMPPGIMQLCKKCGNDELRMER
jgi:hypothetical protein